MKFSCKTSEFLQALQLAGRAISGQQALPILGNIHLKAENGVCAVSATDLELSIVTKCGAEVEREGAITVPAKALLNFVQYNADPDITLEVTENSMVKCSSKRGKAVIAGESAKEYPFIAEVEGKTAFTMEPEPLLEALNLVTFPSARNTLRPVLSGVFLKGAEGSLTMVATDSYRLSEYILPAPAIIEAVTCIVPVKVLDELKSIIGGKKPAHPSASAEAGDAKEKKMEVSVILGTQQIGFSFGQTRLLSRLIEGKFPPYQEIIPKTEGTTVFLSTEELLTAVRRMHYFAKEVNNNLTFRFSQGQAHVLTPQTPAGRRAKLNRRRPKPPLDATNRPSAPR